MSYREIMESRGLKPNTVNTYTRHLESLAKAYGIPLDQALKEDVELKTFNKLYAEKSPHSVKATMVSVHSLLCGKKHGNGQKCEHVIAEPFHSRMVEINKAFSSEAEKQEKTEKQAENWATLDELKGLMDKYRRESLEYVCRRTGEKDVEMKDLIHLQKSVILALYLSDESNPPIRSEWGDVHVIFKKDKIKQDPTKNYLFVTGPRRKDLILNDYKTEKTSGPKKFKIGGSLNKYLEGWLKTAGHKSGDPLLLKKTGGGLGRANLSKMLVEITAPLGKRISTQMLRHIFISDKIDQPKLSEKKVIADKMCHSTGMQELYIKH